MALIQHQTVKFTENLRDQAGTADVVVTLSKPSTGLSIPVYACASPFVVENDALRIIVDSVATLTPQPVTVIIDEHAHLQTPELMWSVQAYCAHNEDAMTLADIHVATSVSDASITDEAGDVVIVIGSLPLLNSVVDYFDALQDRTLIYIPAHINDQFNLHRLLEVDTHCSIVPIVSMDVLDTSDAQHCQELLAHSVDLAIAQDSQLFHWIEGNASALATHNADAILDLLTRYSVAASKLEPTLLSSDTAGASTVLDIADAQLSVADSMATIIAVKTRAMVLTEHLPDGTDARVWHLLRTLGLNLYSDRLTANAANLAKQLATEKQTALPVDIGEVSQSIALSPSHLKAAILWLDEQS